MSQADANSLVGEESIRAGHTGTGCYKNHEHHLGRKVTSDNQDASTAVLDSGGNPKPIGVVEMHQQHNPHNRRNLPGANAEDRTGIATPNFQTPVRNNFCIH